MISQKNLYQFQISGNLVEIEPGLWRARTETWGLTAYGKTPDEAVRDMQEAVGIYTQIASFRGVLKRELDRAEVPYTERPMSEQLAIMKWLDDGQLEPRLRDEAGEMTFDFIMVVAG